MDQYINTIITHYNIPECETELRAGLPLEAFGGEKNGIHTTHYRKLIRFLKTSPLFERDSIQTSETLDIFIHSASKVNPNDPVNRLRFTLPNPATVTQFCRTDTLPTNHTLIYRGMLMVPSTEIEISTEPTTEIVVGGARVSKQPVARMRRPEKLVYDMPDERIRLDGKLEIAFDNTRSQFIVSDYTHPTLSAVQRDAESAYDAYKDLVRRRGGFQHLHKTYRLKNRVSVSVKIPKEANIPFGVRVDITAIKSSKTTVNPFGYDEVVPVVSMLESGLNTSQYEYELEMELVRQPNVVYTEEDMRRTIDFVIESIYKPLMVVCRDYTVYTSLREEIDILTLFRKTVSSIYVDRLLTKLSVLEDVRRYRLPQTEDSEKTAIRDKYPNPFSYFHMVEGLSDRQLTQMEQKYNDWKRRPDRLSQGPAFFMSPRVVSIEMDHIREENPDSICHHYTVTDKADGLGMLLYVVSLVGLSLSDDEKRQYSDYEGRLFMIDSNEIVYDTGLRLAEDEPALEGPCIYNGEYVKYVHGDYKDHLLNTYLIFDAYVHRGQDVCSLPLMDTNPESLGLPEEQRIDRLGFSQRFVKGTKKVYTEKAQLETPYTIARKDFYPALRPEQTFESTRTIWNRYRAGLFPYKLDGTIYTPANKPVGFQQEQPDYDMYQHRTWTANLKWKPPSDNSIDFLLTFETEELARYGDNVLRVDKVRTKQRTVHTEVIREKYKVGTLFNGGTGIIKKLACSTLKPDTETRYDNRLRPVMFQPKQPADPDAHVIHIPVSKLLSNKNEYSHSRAEDTKEEARDQTQRVVLHDTIVECVYHPDRPKFERWEVLRTRDDKTYQYKMGLHEQQRIFQKIKACLQVIELSEAEVLEDRRRLGLLRSILRYVREIPGSEIEESMNPYTIVKKNVSRIKSYYATPHDIPTTINFGNAVSVAENIWKTIHFPITEEMITTGQGIPDKSEEEQRYFNRNVNEYREKSATLSLQNFHNKVIKNRILIGNVVRYLKEQFPDQPVRLLDLACGKGSDISKWRDNGVDQVVGIDLFRNNILDETDGACARLAYYKTQKFAGNKPLPSVHFLSGDVSKSMSDGSAFTEPSFKTMYWNLWNPNEEYNTHYRENRFQVVSVMFALHYFFRSKETVDQFIQNVEENLAPGGFFIGACFDGNRVFELVRSLPFGDSINEFKHGKMIWKIIRNFKQTEFPATDQGVGYSVKVLIHSINQIIEEFLVNYEYFLDVCKRRGIVAVEADVLDRMDLPRKQGQSQGVGEFADVFEWMRDLNPTHEMYPISRELMAMEENEKKLSFLSNYFILRKISTADKTRREIIEFLEANRAVNKDMKMYIRKKNWVELHEYVMRVMNTTYPLADFVSLAEPITQPKIKPVLEKTEKSSVASTIDESSSQGSVFTTGSESASVSTSSVSSEPRLYTIPLDIKIRMPTTQESTEAEQEESVGRLEESSIKTTRKMINMLREKIVKYDTGSLSPGDKQYDSILKYVSKFLTMYAPYRKDPVIEGDYNDLELYQKELVARRATST